jgi:hypothetical protein
MPLEILRRLVVRTVPHARDAPVTVAAAGLAAILFVRFLVLQLATLPLPISVYEGHQWRQAFTYGVAWNLAHGGADLLHPRMFAELGRTNVVPMEAPLYPLLASVLLRFTDSPAAARVFSWLGLVATVAVLWDWLADRRSVRGALADRAGLLVALALSPMAAVDFRSVQPEPVAAGLAIASAWQLARYARTDRPRWLASGAVTFALSLLAKPYAVALVPALVLFAAWGRPRWLRRALLASGSLVVATMPWLAWDRWAHHLLATELGGNWVIEIEHPPRALLASVLGGQYSHDVLLRHLPSYAGSWWLVPATATGIYRALAEPRLRPRGVPLLAWAVGTAILLLAFGIRINSNAYYLILGLAPLAWFSALGLGAIVRVLDEAEGRPPVTLFRCALAGVVLLPLGTAFSKASPWASTVDNVGLGLERNRMTWTSDLGLARLLLVLVVVLAIAPRLRPRGVPTWLGAPLLVLLATLGLRSLRDAAQYARFHVAADRRDGFSGEIARLREAVDQHSTTRDLVLLSPGGVYRDPHLVYHYYALRNGLGAEPLKPGDLERLRERGVKLYLQVDQTERITHVPVPGRVLATGAWWRLSCVAADGCPP